MVHEFSRTELLIGAAGIGRLSQSKVAIFGIGGVGSFVAEALARSGVGSFVLIDHDTICVTNINRQIHAMTSTVGRPKVEVMKERILDINPRAKVIAMQRFYLPEVAHEFMTDDVDYIVDAVDTVTAKIDLVVRAHAQHIPIICAMGAGNKLDPSQFEVADLFKTSVCPLAKVMRKELRQRGIEKLKVVYSQEQPVSHHLPAEADCLEDSIHSARAGEVSSARRHTPGSISFVPSVVGLLIAAEVVKDLLGR